MTLSSDTSSSATAAASKPALPTVGLALAVAVLLVGASVLPVGAQEMESLPQVSGAGAGLRPYWHVFAAYTIVVVLIGGWAVSIGRRLRDVESRLNDRRE